MSKPMLTQYNVEIPDEPEFRTRLTRLLKRAKIEKDSLIIVNKDGRAILQFLAPKDDELCERLRGLGAEVREELTLRLELPHHHWELHKLAKTLADEGINILALYSALEGDQMRITLAVDQPANAAALIDKLGFDPDYPVDA
jgi:hypothetical protein